MKIDKKKKIIKFLKILGVLLIIYFAYSMGTLRGLIVGISFTQQKHNETMCDFLGKERDTDGFCLLSDKVYKYRWYIDCGWEKFKIEGNQTPPFLLKYSEYARRVLYYPAMGC